MKKRKLLDRGSVLFLMIFHVLSVVIIYLKIHLMLFHTALALRQAIWRKNRQGWSICGIPQKLYTDNGGDFMSEHILQVCLKPKIELIHAFVIRRLR